MSVIHFSAEELGRIAMCAIKAGAFVSGAPEKALAPGVVKWVSEMARKNSVAYGRRYGELAPVVKPREILDAMTSQLGTKANDCMRFAKHVMLTYNSVESDQVTEKDRERETAIQDAIKAWTNYGPNVRERERAAADRAAAAEAKELDAAEHEYPYVKLQPYTAPPPVMRTWKDTSGRERVTEEYDRKTATNRIKKALRARTGRPWEVKTSESRGGVTIKPPEAARVCYPWGTDVLEPDALREWDESPAGYRGTIKPSARYACMADRLALSKAMRMMPKHSPGMRGKIAPGVFSNWGYGCTEVAVQLAEGRPVTASCARPDYD